MVSAVRMVKLVGLLCLSSVVLVSCAGTPAAHHDLAVPTARPAPSTSSQPPGPTGTAVPSTTTTTTTPVVPTTTTPVVPTTTTPVVSTATQPIPEGSVSFNNVQAQTFAYFDGCKDVTFEIENGSNTAVDSVSVTFTLNEYGADGSYLAPGPTTGPLEVTAYAPPFSQQQSSVQVCPGESTLLPSEDYFQVTGVSGSYSWAT